jgi:hypothetical protein
VSAPVHFEVEVLCDVACQPLCENQRGDDAFESDDDVKMTTDDAFVTCTDCLKALGYDVAPDTQRVRAAA